MSETTNGSTNESTNANIPGVTPPEGDDRFKHVIAVTIAAVTVLAAIMGFLQDQAGTQSASADRAARRYTIEAMGLRTTGQTEKGYGLSTAQSWYELGKLAASAGGQGDANAVRRYQQAQERIAQLSPLLTDTYSLDGRKFEADLYVTRTLELTERAAAASEVSTTWGNKQSAFIFNLTFIAVALALLGLSTAIEGSSRRTFAIASAVIIVGTLLWAGVTLVKPIPYLPGDAIEAYARGAGQAYQGQPKAAIDEYNQALDKAPGYASALYARANAHATLKQYQEAVDDYKAARQAGRDDTSLAWNLGWTYYLMGQFDDAIRTYQHALALKPDLVPVQLNLALSHLVSNRFDAAKQAYATIQEELAQQMAEAQQEGKALPYSFWLYLDSGAQDIDNLLDRLNQREHAWTQAPPSEALSQPDALRAAAQDILAQLKSLSVALEYTGRPAQGKVAARVTPFKFGIFNGGMGGAYDRSDEYVSVTGVAARTPFEAGTPFDLGRQTYFPYAAEQPDMAITRTGDMNDPNTYWLSDTFSMDNIEIMSLLFDYENMRDGQQVLWKVYANGQEDLSMRREQTWNLGLKGGAQKNFSFMFGGPGEYSVEMYVDSQLVQRGNFTLTPANATDITIGAQPADPGAITSENASVAFKDERLHRIGIGTLNQAVWSPDGKQIAVASSIGIYLFDSATLAYQDYLPTDEWITSISYSPDGVAVLAGGADGKLSLWNVAARTLSRSVTAHEGQLLHVVYSADGSRMASSGIDNVVNVWDGVSGLRQHALEGHSDQITAIAFSKDGRLLASGSRDKTVKVWDATSGKELLTIGPIADAIYGMALSPDGTRVAFGGENSSTVAVWDVATPGGKELFTLNTANKTVNSVRFNAGGTQIVTAGNSGVMQVWDAAAGATHREPLHKLTDYTNIYDAVPSPDGGTLLTTGYDRVVRTWDVAGEKPAGSTQETFSTYAGAVAFTPDGNGVVVGNDAGTITVYDAVTGQYKTSTYAHDQPVTGIVFNKAIEQAATAGKDNAVKLWTGQFETVQYALEGHTDVVAAIAFNPAGTRLASASWDKTIKVWDASLGELLHTLEGHTYEVFGVAYSSDGKRIISGSRDMTVKVWDAQSGELLRTLEGHTDSVFAVAVSPDGSQIASASYDATIKLWDAESGELLRTLEGHDGPVYALAFSPDGKTLASGGADHTVKRWDVASGDIVETLEGHTWSVVSIAFSTDGARLVSGSIDGTARIWTIQ
ncbi:MAG: tetratricopeptide repeat protein [Chloroflexi bacterium]|nr:tetratricopeptide repeat protein [Chloroflexota bacterium]